MKKIISLLLCVLMVISSVSIFADSSASEAMETVLINVKSKVNIPEKFSEFTPYANEYDGKLSYEFNWQTEDGNSYIEVSCDDSGRIYRYYFYDNTLKSEKKLTTLSKDDIVKTAEEFLKKALPEAFTTNNDVLLYDDTSWNVSGNTYRIRFERYHDGIYVKDNFVDFRIFVYDNVAYVKSMNVAYNFEYEDEFVLNESFVHPLYQYNLVLSYNELFPLELIYRDVYSHSSDDESKTALVYQPSGGGYVSAITNEVITEDVDAELYLDSLSGGYGGGMLKEEAALNSALTEKELKEIGVIEGLISKEEADKIIRNLPYVDLTSNMKISSYRISQRDDEYIVNISYGVSDDEYKYLSATLDGKSGKLLSMYSGGKYDNEKTELSEAQKNSAMKKIEEFLKKTASEEFLQCKKQNDSSYNFTYSDDFDRYVNDIRYINDGINVSFNAKTGKITSYTLDFKKDKVFDTPSDVVSVEKAIHEFVTTNPVRDMFIMSGGKYQHCFTLKNQNIQLDAFTGEEYKEETYYEQQSYEYSDIKGHWAEEKINKLAEIQIGFEGEKFNPDLPISQYDLLRLFAAGIHYQDYITYPEDMLYENFIYDGILKEEEKNPDGQVLREDAFVYMVRLDGLDKVAKLSNIFKVEYADGNLLSKGKIGYPAILTGMNVICGNGGYLKPKTPITRAEAAVMVYNYMINEN